MAFTSSKTYGAERGLTCAYRQWAATSHCAQLHGYALGFRFVFAAEQLDARGWVVDFGSDGFGDIRAWLHQTFDHTLLVAQDDPARASFIALRDEGLADVRILPGTSCEAIAAHVFAEAQSIIHERTGGRCWVASVECLEHGANGATFHNPDAVLRQVTSETLAALIGSA